jgi:hypothetical protein
MGVVRVWFKGGIGLGWGMVGVGDMVWLEIGPGWGWGAVGVGVCLGMK